MTPVCDYREYNRYLNLNVAKTWCPVEYLLQNIILSSWELSTLFTWPSCRSIVTCACPCSGPCCREMLVSASLVDVVLWTNQERNLGRSVGRTARHLWVLDPCCQVQNQSYLPSHAAGSCMRQSCLYVWPKKKCRNPIYWLLGLYLTPQIVFCIE